MLKDELCINKQSIKFQISKRIKPEPRLGYTASKKVVTMFLFLHTSECIFNVYSNDVQNEKKIFLEKGTGFQSTF